MARAKQTIDQKRLSHWNLLDEFSRQAHQGSRMLQNRSKSRPADRSVCLASCLKLFQPHALWAFQSSRGHHARALRGEPSGACAKGGLRPESESWQLLADQGVFDPELLRQVFLDLSAEIPVSWGDARLRHLADKLNLVDGTLLTALPRMHWALWINEQNRAAKLHLKFSVLRQAACDALITTGNSCERKALREFVKKGETVVGDRYYGLEYGFFGELRKLGASFVMRIRNEPLMEIMEELPLTEADRAAGVTWQAMVKLGVKWQGEAIRVVKVEVDGKPLLLATDLNLDAELIALIYRYRWQIELFFKWFKSISAAAT